jgi:hypothetical protein
MKCATIQRATKASYWKDVGQGHKISGSDGFPIETLKSLIFYTVCAPRGSPTYWCMDEYLFIEKVLKFLFCLSFVNCFSTKKYMDKW